MNRRRFLTAKEVQAMMQAARQGLPANGTTASFCWPFAMACALANCWICIITIWISMKGGLMCGD